MLLIVAIAWIYVVGLMALTETSVVAGIMTFLLYCVLPLGVVLYIMGSGKRKRRIREREALAREAAGKQGPAAPGGEP